MRVGMTGGSAYDSDAPIFQQVRADIRAGRLDLAEELLESVSFCGAEWYFLKGAVYYRRGWLDEALRHYDTAARLEPENREYRQAAERMRGGPRYHPEGKSFGTLCAEGACVGLGCVYVLCKVSGCACCCGSCFLCSHCIGEMPR